MVEIGIKIPHLLFKRKRIDMSKRNRYLGLFLLITITLSVIVVAFLWFKPHRNVQSSKVDIKINVKDLVKEFSDNPEMANAKYLSSDGNSKILAVVGHVFKISKNQNAEAVIIIKEDDSKVGVNANFTKETTPSTATVKIGDLIIVKGAITSGNSYNSDLALYEHAVIINCNLVKE